MRWLKASRSGFTLVELLVVLSLILLLAALAVAFVPRIAERQNVYRAADRVQGWLLIARQWAKVPQATGGVGTPTGVRLQLGQTLPNPASPNKAYVTDLQYIQQPPDFLVQPGLNSSAVPNVRRLSVSGTTAFLERLPTNLRPPTLPAGTPPPVGTVVPADFSAGYGGTIINGNFVPLPLGLQVLWPVQPGDYLEVGGGGLVRQITSIQSHSSYSPAFPGDTMGPDRIPGSLSLEANELTLSSSVAQSISATTYYRIVRGPRLVAGEQALQLTQDVAIDLNLCRLPGGSFNPYNPSPTDILFSPTGPITGPGASVDKMILFLRDVTKSGLQGDMRLITVNCRTGSIGAQQVDTTVSTLSLTSFTVPPAGPPLYLNNPTPPPITTLPPMQVANATGIVPGMYLLLDPDGPNPEVQKVAAIPASNTIQLLQLNYTHTAPFRVIINPYSFVEDARTSGF
jgi:prepilin-type N-terminal cleavage/methylation domain-containing protein